MRNKLIIAIFLVVVTLLLLATSVDGRKMKFKKLLAKKRGKCEKPEKQKGAPTCEDSCKKHAECPGADKCCKGAACKGKQCALPIGAEDPCLDINCGPCEFCYMNRDGEGRCVHQANCPCDTTGTEGSVDCQDTDVCRNAATDCPEAAHCVTHSCHCGAVYYDEFLNEICQSANNTDHPGECRPPIDGGADTCANECQIDDDCGAGHKCCPNNCGATVCQHTGDEHLPACPLSDDGNTEGTCANECSSDADCVASDGVAGTCCINGCGAAICYIGEIDNPCALALCTHGHVCTVNIIGEARCVYDPSLGCPPPDVDDCPPVNEDDIDCELVDPLVECGLTPDSGMPDCEVTDAAETVVCCPMPCGGSACTVIPIMVIDCFEDPCVNYQETCPQAHLCVPRFCDHCEAIIYDEFLDEIPEDVCPEDHGELPDCPDDGDAEGPCANECSSDADCVASDGVAGICCITGCGAAVCHTGETDNPCMVVKCSFGHVCTVNILGEARCVYDPEIGCPPPDVDDCPPVFEDDIDCDMMDPFVECGLTPDSGMPDCEVTDAAETVVCCPMPCDGSACTVIPIVVIDCFEDPCADAEVSCPQAHLCVPRFCDGCEAIYYDEFFYEIPEDVCPGAHAGSCPPPPPASEDESCESNCQTDADCDSAHKCCPLGCPEGMSCQLAVPDDLQFCPSTTSGGTGCDNQCESNADCTTPDGQPSLCCINDCGAAVCHSEQAGSPCDQPMDVGPCEAIFPRFYFDQETGSCLDFNYGGCAGNENNFLTLEECLGACACSLPPVVGDCDAAIPRFYHEPEELACIEFTYGGCGGNGNNFETMAQCRHACICNLPPETGPCEAAMTRFYFNPETQACEEFMYGGCLGNANNFETFESCMESCMNDQ